MYRILSALSLLSLLSVACNIHQKILEPVFIYRLKVKVMYYTGNYSSCHLPKKWDQTFLALRCPDCPALHSSLLWDSVWDADAVTRRHWVSTLTIRQIVWWKIMIIRKSFKRNISILDWSVLTIRLGSVAAKGVCGWARGSPDSVLLDEWALLSTFTGPQCAPWELNSSVINIPVPHLHTARGL